MTQFIAANIGSYPRIGEEKDQQRFRRGYTNFENKEISAHAMNDVIQSVVQEIVREQILGGLDEVTDGLISWTDPISHFCKNVNGIKLEGLHRYFDTNFYYRQPVIVSKPRLRDPVMAFEYENAKKVSSKPVWAVVTGPYTLASHTISTLKNFGKFTTRLEFFGDLVSAEVRALAKSGAKHLQIDEPSLGKNPKELPALQKVFERIIQAAVPSQITMGLYFSPLTDLLESLLSWPLAGLHLDFTYDGKKLLDKLMQSAPPFEIGFGLVNGRSTKPDPIDPILTAVRSFCDKYQPALCRITPSCGLELLPRDSAISKLNLLSKIKDELNSPAAKQAANV